MLRQRVVAYFQRMVQGVGRLAFPYAAPLVDRVRASGSASDLKECFVLCNQLCATFKKDLAPFAETVTPALIAQTAAALAPFASPDGHAHGVLGVCALARSPRPAGTPFVRGYKHLPASSRGSAQPRAPPTAVRQWRQGYECHARKYEGKKSARVPRA